MGVSSSIYPCLQGVALPLVHFLPRVSAPEPTSARLLLALPCNQTPRALNTGADYMLASSQPGAPSGRPSPGRQPPAQVPRPGRPRPSPSPGRPCFSCVPVVRTSSTFHFRAYSRHSLLGEPGLVPLSWREGGGSQASSGVLPGHPDVSGPLRKFGLRGEFSGLAEAPAAPPLPAARGRRPGRLRPWFLPGQGATRTRGSRLPVLLRGGFACAWGVGPVPPPSRIPGVRTF